METSSEGIQKILNATDWMHYRQAVNWSICIPECHFYDGEQAQKEKRICPVWQDWLNKGRTLYSEGESGLTEYLEELKHIVPEGFRKMDHERAKEFLTA